MLDLGGQWGQILRAEQWRVEGVRGPALRGEGVISAIQIHLKPIGNRALFPESWGNPLPGLLKSLLREATHRERGQRGQNGSNSLIRAEQGGLKASDGPKWIKFPNSC